MITLKINNSMSQITGLTVGQFKEVKELLSYDIGNEAAYYSGSLYNTKRSLLSKRGEFPTGLVRRIELWRNKASLNVETQDLRKRPISPVDDFSLSLAYTPYKEQLQAAYEACGADRGIIKAVTGSGKSLIAALIIHGLQVPTLVVVPSLELKRQLTGSLAKAFGSQKVGSICDNKPIAVENVDALETKPLKGYDCVIIDEFHRSAARTFRELNKKSWGGIYYRFGLTATPIRSNESEMILLESILAEVIYEIPYSVASEKGYIVPVEAYTCSVPKTTMKGNERDWRSVYDELIVNNTNRNNSIASILTTLKLSNRSTLCLVKEIKHGEILSELTGVPFANGQSEGSSELISKFNSGELNALIGTSGVIGEGVDTKPCEYVLLASTGKSKVQFMQNVGRCMRKYSGKETGKVIMFKDSSHKYLTRHFKACVKYLEEEYGILPACL